MKMLIFIALIAATGFCVPQAVPSATARADIYLQQMDTNARNAIADAADAAQGQFWTKILAKDLNLGPLCVSAAASVHDRVFSNSSHIVDLHESFATALTDATPAILKVVNTSGMDTGDCSLAGSNCKKLIGGHMIALAKCLEITHQTQLAPSLTGTLKGACRAGKLDGLMAKIDTAIIEIGNKYGFFQVQRRDSARKSSLVSYRQFSA